MLKKYNLLILGGLALFLAAISVSNVLWATPREIKIILGKTNVFTVVGSNEPIIHVKAGEVVRLTFIVKPRQVNVAHTFTVKEFKNQGWSIKLGELGEGTISKILVVPEQPGEYLFECLIICGNGHENMNGKLIIE